jgi:hypothetical protein
MTLDPEHMRDLGREAARYRRLHGITPEAVEAARAREEAAYRASHGMAPGRRRRGRQGLYPRWNRLLTREAAGFWIEGSADA